ncbi:lysR substrate binding domain protein [Acinetobacter baumannii 1457504]|nr:lysR substrate binding domain protein [Acinetobacter baumannii 1457504]
MQAKLNLNEFGNIKSPDELSDHRILSLSEEHLDQQFILHGPDNQLKKVKVSPTIMETNIYMLAQLASQNCGIALLPDTAAEDFVKSGQLVQILPDWKAAHVYSMLFIRHEEVYCQLYVYLLIIFGRTSFRTSINQSHIKKFDRLSNFFYAY